MADLASVQAELEALRSTSLRSNVQQEQALHDLEQQLALAQQSASQHEQELALAAEREALLAREKADLNASLDEERASLARLQKEHDQHGKGSADGERVKRDLLEQLERAEADKASLQDSLSSLRLLHSELQSSSSSLESQLLEHSTTSRTSLLRIQTLESTISSLSADKEFLQTELSTGRSEWSASRQQAHAELLRVSSALENAQLDLQHSQSSLTAVKASHEKLKSSQEATAAELAQAREELAANEAAFAQEMSGLRRLVDAMEAREADRKKRVEAVEASLEEERTVQSAREHQIGAELNNEREQRDRLEVEVAELKAAIQQGSAWNSEGVNGRSFDLSPSGELAVKSQRKGRSYAEVYGEYVRMGDELARSQAENVRLEECLNQILLDVEERAPLLQQQREEYDRLSEEATHLASQLAEALAQRDNANRTSATSSQEIVRLERENGMLTAQLTDLGRQLRTLLRTQAAAEYSTLSREAVEEFDEEEAAIARRAEASNDTDAVVSAHLVTFSSVNELQLQNQKLLRITREMGVQLERGEIEASARREGEENRAVEEAHELIISLRDQIQSERARAEALVRERDMFRRMLGQQDTGSSAAAVNGAIANVDPDLPGALAAVQANFDAYRTEITVDTQRLREDLSAAQREAQTARTDLAKAKAQAEFLAERYRLLNDSFELQQSEVSSTAKRLGDVQANMARQELGLAKAEEEARSAKGVVEQLRHENTTLKSEREVGKSVEKRLVEENSALSRERAHLADLMRNLQTMQNELERSSSDSRRRLEESVVRLEAQTADLKEKLNAESDTSRQLSLRKELDGKTYQDRLDKLNAELASTREAHIVAKTSLEHQQQRVADLQLQVTSREEKLAIYEGRQKGSGDVGKTAEEQLEVTVADLRAELRAAQGELERAKAHLLQYQAIAETEGESLRQMTSTYDTFKADSERALAEKDAELSSVRERLHSLTEDLTAANNTNSTLHAQIEAERVAFEKERKALEDGLAGLRSADETARQAGLAAQEDVKRQAQLAKDAHDKYDRELVAHAEDVKRLSEIKGELDAVRAEVNTAKQSEQVARANLLQSEESFARQKAALEGEVADVQRRVDDLTKQNAVLHEHLETFNSHASKLKAAASTSELEGGSTDPAQAEALAAAADASVDQLREVVKYLRREKDIIDLQLDFSKQEATRLRQQLEFTSRSLDDTRASLAEERTKSAESTSSSAQHQELLERIHTATLLRESNQTLRDENESNLRKVSALDTKLKSALAELDPLKERVQTLTAEVDAKQHSIRLLEEDNERWKTRNQTILAKYERIDPEELQQLKTQVDALQQEKLALEEKVQGAGAVSEEKLKAVESAREEVEKQLAARTTEVGQWKDRFKQVQQAAREHRDKANALEAEKTALDAKVTELDAKISELEAAAATAAAAPAPAPAAVEAPAAPAAESTASAEALATLTAERDGLIVEKDKLTADLAALNQRSARLMEHNKVLIAQKTTFDTALAGLKEELAVKTTELESAKSEFEAKHKELIEAAVAEKLSEAEPVSLNDEQIAEKVAQKVAEAEATLAAARDQAIAEAVAAATAPLEAELTSLRVDLASAQAVVPAAAGEGANEEELTKLREELDAAKAAKETALANQKAHMQKQLDAIKARVTAEAKAKETELTERLTAEIKAAQDGLAVAQAELVDAKAQTEAAKAAVIPAADGSAPVIDVDALLVAKLAELEPERIAAQEAAIQTAVEAAVEKQKAEAAAELKGAVLKGQLQLRKEFNAYKKLHPATDGGAASPTVAATTAPSLSQPTINQTQAPSPVTPAQSPLPPLQAQGNGPAGSTSPTAGRGRGGARGARGGAAPRGGSVRGAAQAASVPVASIRGAAAPRGTAVRGGAARGGAAAAGGGLLGRLMNQGGSQVKRGRESEDGSAGVDKKPKTDGSA